MLSTKIESYAERHDDSNSAAGFLNDEVEEQRNERGDYAEATTREVMTVNSDCLASA